MIIWIIFLHLFDDFRHAHPHYIFVRLFDMGISQSFRRSYVHDMGPIQRNIVYFNSLLHFLLYSNNPPYLCFPFIGGRYVYSRFCIRYDSYFFLIIGRIFNIRAFNVANKMCGLVSTGVEPLYINSFSFFYSQFGFLYFGCTGGIQIIH